MSVSVSVSIDDISIGIGVGNRIRTSRTIRSSIVGVVDALFYRCLPAAVSARLS